MKNQNFERISSEPITTEHEVTVRFSDGTICNQRDRRLACNRLLGGFLEFVMIKTEIGNLSYEIGGVGVQMTESLAKKWNDGTVSEDDLLAIEVIAEEDRWPGGRPSMKSVRDTDRFLDLWRMIDCQPANRISHN